ncbi:uncharacterized protein JCM10292_002894 [Rhodotorula paludigena]|uniref:uncharacterized protein n=1 Tax=Rhodotorula paludigena TaxID=86838 RepID=UPI00316C5ABC
MAGEEEHTAAVTSYLAEQASRLRSSNSAVALSNEDALSAGADLRGKVVVITGAASGFGRSYALKAAQLGAKVVLGDLKQESVNVVATEIRANGGQAEALACDVTDWDAQVKLFRHARNTFGHIDVVAVNAGIAESSDRFLNFAKTDNGEPVKPRMPTVDVNIVGAGYTTKLAFFHLRENPAKEGKAVVILGSMASWFGLPGAPVYCMSKHAMLGLFRSLYFDAQLYDIHLNLVCPFFVHTSIFGTLPKLLLAGIPLPSVDEVVNAMVAATAKDVTGSVFVVDFKGICEVPWAAYAHGPDGYYQVFARRAQGLMSFGKWAFDVVSAVVGAFKGR